MLKTLFYYSCIFSSLFLTSTVHARLALLQEERQIYFVDEQFELGHIERAVKGALNARNWQIESQGVAKTNEIVASLYVRSHKIVVNLAYSKEKLVLSYLDSTNMKYKEKNGEKYIHGNYHKWTEVLLNHFRGHVGLLEPYDDLYHDRGVSGGVYVPRRTPRKIFRRRRAF